MSYYRTIKLNHNQIPAILDKETGEVKPLEGKSKKNGMAPFDLMDSYHRMNSSAWELLATQTTKNEYAVAHRMAIMARQGNNSIVPLNDDSTNVELSQALSTDKETVRKYIDKLFKLGVIAKFEIYEHDAQYKKYWIFNPYLSFNGAYIHKDVSSLFANTTYAKISKNRMN